MPMTVELIPGFEADVDPETRNPRLRFNFANGWTASVVCRAPTISLRSPRGPTSTKGAPTMFVKIGDSFVNPSAIAAILPYNGQEIQGIPVTPPDPNRCLIMTIAGKTTLFDRSPEETAMLISSQAEAV